MCGLVGWCSKPGSKMEPEAVYDYVADQYEEQHGRGTKGFGIVAVQENGTVKIKRATEPVKMFFDLYLAKTKHLFLHHRQPTSSENWLSQTHPFVVEHDELEFDYHVMHNGVITNTHTLKPEHEAMGYRYESEHEEYLHGSSGTTKTKHNDSESFAIEIARFLEGKTKHLSSKGNQAFIVFRMIKATSKIDAVIAGRNEGNPLKFYEGENGFAMASEEDEGAMIGKDTAFIFKASYTKAGQLRGFAMEQKSVPLFFAPIVSTYYDRETYHAPSADTMDYRNAIRSAGIENGVVDVPPSRNSWSPSHMNSVHPAGFHASMGHHQAPPPASAPVRDAVVREITKEGQFETYGECIEFFERSPLGEILRAKDTKESEFVKLFPWTPIRNHLIMGLIDQAEDLWLDYSDNILDMVELGDMMSDAINTQPTIKKNMNLNEIIRLYQQSNNTRMGVVAKTLVPFFKINAFMEVMFRGCYTIKYRSEEDEGLTRVEAINLEEEADRLLLKSAEESMEERPGYVWTGGAWVKKDDDDLSVAVADTVVTTDSQPGVMTMLSILEDAAETMEPNEILREAEIIGDAIRKEAATAMDEQLSEMTSHAAEQGLVLSLPFFDTKIRDIQNDTSIRFTRLARLVQHAHERDEYEYGPEYDHE